MKKEFNPADSVFRNVEKTCTITASRVIDKYTATVESSSPRCPKEPPEGPIHPMRAKGIKQFAPKYDIVNGFPALVELDAINWYCLVCRTDFTDPAYPYEPRKKTSTRFDDFIAQTLLSDISLTQDSIAKAYGISRQIAQRAISGYMDRVVKNLNFAKLECDRFWLIKGELGSKVGLIVLGDPSERQRKILGDMLEDDQIVLLGITKPYSLKNLANEALSLDKNTTAEVICSPGLKTDAKDYFLNAAINASGAPRPKILDRIENAITTMSDHGLTFEEIKLRIFFQDEFRRAEVRLQGGGYHLGPLKTHSQDGEQKMNCATFFEQLDEEVTLHDSHVVVIADRAAIIDAECNHFIEQYYYMASVSKFLERYE